MMARQKKKVQEKQKLPEPFEQRRLQAMKEIIPPPPAEHKTQMNKSHQQNIKLRVNKSCQETKNSQKCRQNFLSLFANIRQKKKQTIKDSDSKWESASGIHKRIGQDVSQTVNQMPTQPEQKIRKNQNSKRCLRSHYCRRRQESIIV